MNAVKRAELYYKEILSEDEQKELDTEFSKVDIPDREARFYQWIANEKLEQCNLFKDAGEFVRNPEINFDNLEAKISERLNKGDLSFNEKQPLTYHINH